ncbi:MAG: hypothetical protein U0270_04120 [Labilithrix sp.]
MSFRTCCSASIAFFSLIGCTAPAETASASVDALEETPSTDAETATQASEDQLAFNAEALYTQAEGLTPDKPDGKPTIVFSIGDGSPVSMNGGEALEVVMPDKFSQTLEVTVQAEPALLFRRIADLAVGSRSCKEVTGGVILIDNGTRFAPKPGTRCTIAITKMYEEPLTPKAAVLLQHTHLKPRTIIVGTISAELKSADGTQTRDVRGGFVLPTAFGH